MYPIQSGGQMGANGNFIDLAVDAQAQEIERLKDELLITETALDAKHVQVADAERHIDDLIKRAKAAEAQLQHWLNVDNQALKAAEARVREIEAETIKRCWDIAAQKSAMLANQNDFDRGYACGRTDAALAIRALAKASS